MEDSRRCDQCGKVFEPRREHSRFCSSLCRVTWNRENAGSQLTSDTPLNWSVAALEDTTVRLCKAGAMSLPEALAVISEAVWWVTLVDATMIRYHHDVYDRTMDSLDPAERKVTEGTFTGLRFVRNSMGYYVDAADFIQPQQNSRGGDAPVSAWTWRQVAPPASMPLPQRAKVWEAGRYMHYRAYLADRPVGETIKRATEFLARLAPAPADRIGQIHDPGLPLTRADVKAKSAVNGTRRRTPGTFPPGKA